MKKIPSLILCALLLVPAFTACAETSENAETAAETVPTAVSADETTVGEEEETALSDNLGEHDFEGYNFRISSNNEEYIVLITADDYTGVPVNDALRTSTLAVEDRFNIDITWDLISGGGDAYRQLIRAGENSHDIQISVDWVIYPLAPEGYYIDLFEVEQFDFSKPWWPKNITETLTVCGSMYTAANYMSYQGLAWTRAIMINKDIAEKLNYEIPYDTVREGKWTLDAMFAYVRDVTQDTNGDGKIDGSNGVDRIGFATGNGTGYTLQESVGIFPYTHDADGNVVLDIDVDRIDTFITKMREFMATDDFYYTGGFGETFQKGSTLMCLGWLQDAYNIYSGEDFKYGFLSAPKYDENQEEYINSCTDCPWAIPITAAGEEQLDIIGTVCEALSCKNYQTAIPAYFEVAMKSRLADSPDDAEQLQLIADTRTTSFSYAYDLVFKNILMDLQDNNQGVSSYLASKSKSAEKLLNKFIGRFEKIKEDRES